MIRFSDRTAFDPTPNALTRAVRGVRADFDLTVSDPTHARLPYDAAAVRSALARPQVMTDRPHPLGLPAAREAVAAALGVEAERVVLTASTSEAYGWLLKILCDPGDDVLLPQPGYPLVEHLATFEGVALRPYRLRYEGRWVVDPASLTPGPRTRAVLTVNPANPTGQYLSRDDLEHLLALGLPVVSDEVFARYPLCLDEDRIKTLAHLDRGLAFALGGLSKWAGLPQMKLGWIVVAGDPVQAARALERLEIVADAFLSVGAPVQHAVDALLAGPTAAAIHARVQANFEHLVVAAQGATFDVLPAEGGWYAVLRLPAVQDDEAWTLALLAEASVRVQPGWLYDFADGPFVVVSLLTPRDVFGGGVAALRRFVDAVS